MIMKKLLLALVFFGMLGSTSYAQTMRMGDCRRSSDGDRIYVTIYGAPGFGKYTFDPLTLGPKSMDWASTKTLWQWQGGATIHYRFERFNLGVGAVYQKFSGKITELPLLSNTEIDLAFRKLYASLEIPFYSDSFADIGWGANAGAFMVDGQFFENPKSPIFFETGFYYNMIINSYSSFITKLYYGKNFFNTSLNNVVSKQHTYDLSLQMGFRFWF
jgi:hypothetical protein